MPNQAVILHTHLTHVRIYQHFQRMQHEATGLLPVYLNLHRPRGTVDDPIVPVDFQVTEEDGQRLLPGRAAQRIALGRGYDGGFTDLSYLPALLHPALARFDYLWMIEYDVDYAGHWRDFFAETMDSTADFLGTTFRTREEDPLWTHWSWFKAPADVLSRSQYRSFIPIARFSRRLLDCYVSALNSGAWEGHTEALYPTLALHTGMTIEDLGGMGHFALPGRRRLYWNTPEQWHLSPGTLVYRPAAHRHYFHEEPRTYAEQGFLYHPVKGDFKG